MCFVLYFFFIFLVNIFIPKFIYVSSTIRVELNLYNFWMSSFENEKERQYIYIFLLKFEWKMPSSFQWIWLWQRKKHFCFAMLAQWLLFWTEWPNCVNEYKLTKLNIKWQQMCERNWGNVLFVCLFAWLEKRISVRREKVAMPKSIMSRDQYVCW